MRDGEEVTPEPDQEARREGLYGVFLLNDDYTPMEFVVQVIENVFGKNHEDAVRTMLHVHEKGIGECGVYDHDGAKTKAKQVMDFAREHKHPLQCVMEKK
jgi:ATP-dependent Clp protease adaptor protein ClpS